MSGELLFVGRLLFGGVLAFTGVNHFLDLDDMTGYAAAKGLPAPRFAVIASGVMLVLGGIGIVLGAYPTLAAGAIAVFLVVATPKMHDFWNAPDDQQQTEMTQFLKNAALLGAALAFLVLGGETWNYAVNVGLF
jgi:uncharacterized membrane protein YphA (DoxX/SURF4 family)